MVTVELFGLARHLTKRKEVDVGDCVTLKDVVAALSKKVPILMEKVINPNTYELLPIYSFVITGRDVAQDLSVQVNEGDRILLVYRIGGG